MKPRLPGHTAFVGFDVYQNDVGADPLDAIPGDDIVIPPPHKTQMPAGSGDDNGGDAAVAQVDPCVGNEAQSPAVADADDFLAVQIREFGHTQPPIKCLVKDMRRKGRI